jgi:chlorobactene glucosyltransferase
VVDDLALARTIKAAGYRWRVLDATALVSCRMYRSGQEAYAGLSKNLFAAAGCRVIPYLFVSLWLLVLFLYPPILLGLFAGGLATGAPIALTSACIVLALAVWLIPYRALRLPAWLAALYPLVVAVSALVALRSLWLTATGRLTWKGRRLKRLAWRLF